MKYILNTENVKDACLMWMQNAHEVFEGMYKNDVDFNVTVDPDRGTLETVEAAP